MLLGTLILTTTIVTATASAAEVYKYKDDKGNTLYTDKPVTLPAEHLNVQTRKSDSSAASRPSSNDELKRMQDTDAARKQDTTQKTDDKQAAQNTAKDKLERCTKARDKYETYLTSRKLYEEQPGGGRRYLSSEELDSARAAAKTNMDVWCK
jgi:hypothetical protein